MNGFFQLLFDNNGSNLVVYPPTGGGAIVEPTEIMNYLNGRNIKFEMTSLVNQLKSADSKKIIHLSDEQGHSEVETLVVSMTDDRMSATVRFYPPSVGGTLLTEKDILNDLKKMGIVSGIDLVALASFLGNRVYCTDIEIAKGTKPVHGSDARIEYYFNTDLSAKPTLLEDGTVDFFHLNTMNHCKQGQLLAKLIKEDPGKIGESIIGERIKPRDVKKMSLKFGRNITRSEDRTELRSDVNGHVSLVDGKVFVSNIYQIENVDNSTGNIEYEGAVQVSGNVYSNFTIKAQGDVTINGVVEGAYIEAGGNIIINRGINGMNKGVLKAGGNIVAKFIENATVIADGYVETEAVLHSKIMSKDEVIVVSHKGYITGGEVSATKAIRVKNLGSPMGADTIVEIGVDPAIKNRYEELMTSIRETKKLLESIRPVIAATGEKIKKGAQLKATQVLYFKKLAQTSKEKQEQLVQEEAELESLNALMHASTKAEVVVSGKVFPGTKIVISDVSTIVKEPLQYCRFVRQGGDVKMISIN